MAKSFFISKNSLFVFFFLHKGITQIVERSMFFVFTDFIGSRSVFESGESLVITFLLVIHSAEVILRSSIVFIFGYCLAIFHFGLYRFITFEGSIAFISVFFRVSHCFLSFFFCFVLGKSRERE